MYIITEKGELIEGLALTPYEVELTKTLKDRIQEVSPTYVEDRSAKAIVRYLIANYLIAPRNPPSPELLNVEEDQLPEVV